MQSCNHLSISLQKYCLKCSTTVQKLQAKFCGKCRSKELFAYYCTDCPAPSMSACQHQILVWKKRCNDCGEEAESMSSKFCSECGESGGFQPFCIECNSQSSGLAQQESSIQSNLLECGAPQAQQNFPVLYAPTSEQKAVFMDPASSGSSRPEAAPRAQAIAAQSVAPPRAAPPVQLIPAQSVAPPRAAPPVQLIPAQSVAPPRAAPPVQLIPAQSVAPPRAAPPAQAIPAQSAVQMNPSYFPPSPPARIASEMPAASEPQEAAACQSNFVRSRSMRDFGSRGRNYRGQHQDRDQPSYHESLNECCAWIEVTMKTVLRMSGASAFDASSLDRVSRELNERWKSISTISRLGRRLASDNAGNSQLCKEIDEQVRWLKDNYAALKETIEQLQASWSASSHQTGRRDTMPSSSGARATVANNSNTLMESLPAPAASMQLVSSARGAQADSSPQQFRRHGSLRERGHQSQRRMQSRQQWPQGQPPLPEETSSDSAATAFDAAQLNEQFTNKCKLCTDQIQKLMTSILNEASNQDGGTSNQPSNSSRSAIVQWFTSHHKPSPTPQQQEQQLQRQQSLFLQQQNARLNNFCSESDQLKSNVDDVNRIGKKLAQLCPTSADQVNRQLVQLKRSYGVLKETVIQIRNKCKRRFDCGHTEELDWHTSCRRINNRFCSNCWPLSSQIQADRLAGGSHQSVVDGFRRIKLHEDKEETALEYVKIHDRVMRYVKPEHNMNIKVQSIEKIENPALDKRLYNVFNDLFKKDCTPELLIHGTSGSNAESIMKDGFCVGSQGMYGAGIYFATDSTKSAQYSRESGVKTLLLCEVVLGKTMLCNSPRQDLNLEAIRKAGYDSVFAKRNTKGTGGVVNDEYIVYRPEQATPKYLVKFTC